MTIRFKLATTIVAVLLIANSLLSFLVLEYLSHVWLREVQTRVQRNLAAARTAYDDQGERIAAVLEGMTFVPAFAAAVQRGDTAQVTAALGETVRTRRIDFALLLTPAGKVMCRAPGKRTGDELSADPLASAALRQQARLTGSLLLSRQRLLTEGEALADRARFELVPTPAARPAAENVRTDGMLVAAAVPVRDAQGQMCGLLYAAQLLNRRYEIVDAIKRQVFAHETLGGPPVGTVTICQGDLRISTNALLPDGSRAVGTRVSADVCEVVLDHGGVWAAPAVVINDWYFTAYEPIRDPNGQIIGTVCTGLPQEPFLRQRDRISRVVLSVVVGSVAVSLLLLFVAMALVLRPIRHVVVMAQKVIGGDLTARMGIRPPGEMGVLCWAIDSMAQAVAEREEALQLATRQQVGRSEQLAAVGRLAAGVAHEINNPLTGVLAFSDMLREKENMDDQDREDLDLIIRETKRAREIVRGLLDFARETPTRNVRFDINELARSTLKLLGNREAFQNICVVDDLGENVPEVYGDRNQLQQVLLNLSLNACEAMPNGGTLMLSTSSAPEGVMVQVVDTGCGIKPEDLDRIFEPFFTTKPVGKGTGLGLSVSYGIIQQHGGKLDVQSQIGKGTTFKIILPSASAVEARTTAQEASTD